MYHPALIARSLEKLARLDAFRAVLPSKDLLAGYPVRDAQALARQLSEVWDAETRQTTRPLTPDEQRFVLHEQLRCPVDYRYWAERYCNPPEAPIWMGDLTFKPLGDVKVGDVVIGWEKGTDRKGRKRFSRDHLVRTRVVALTRRTASLVRVTLASGRMLRCTPDHLWANGRYATCKWKDKTGHVQRYHYPWIRAAVGTALAHVVDPVVVPTGTERLCGWLGGVYDGEESHYNISQYQVANPLVHHQIGDALTQLAIPHTGRVKGYNLRGGRQGYLRFLLLAQPHKRRWFEKNLLGYAFKTPDRVVSVEPDGVGEVISLQTETGNYIAWGYASKNCQIDTGGRLRSLYPMWESQAITLETIAKVEQAHDVAGHPDGVLLAILKARQLGLSTLVQSIVAHRVTTHPYVRALIAADVPDQALYLFSMLELVEEHLPWFLRPTVVAFSRHVERAWANHSVVKSAAGLSRRGALKEKGGQKGNIGRGRTYLLTHISEVSTWENPDQLREALLPGLPILPETFSGFESSAKGRHDYWHDFWDAACNGVGRFAPVFISWAVEAKKWSLPAPADWSPAVETYAAARRAEADAPRWVGHPIHLTRDQLYWYETERASWVAAGDLAGFYSEYPTTPDEAFQHAGRSIFPLDVRTRIRAQQRPLKAAFEVKPAADLALIKEFERQQAATNREAGELTPDPPSPRGGSVAKAWGIDDSAPLPKGYGLKLIPPAQFFRERSLGTPETLLGCLLIWEFPRTRGERRYVLSADPADGLGQNRASVDVLRVGTLDEPAEQVAHYASPFITPTQVAFVIYSLGRWYRDDRNLSALVAIEVNNHGRSTQDTLRLHLRYTRLYRWQIMDHVDPQKRFTQRIGWETSPRTRPIMLDKFYEAVTTVDPVSELPDLRINSPITLDEMVDFQTPDILGNAEAARGAFDDCVMSLAVGYIVAWQLAAGELEPLDERRRRRSLELARRQAAATPVEPRDYRNTDCTADEMQAGIDDTPIRDDDEVGDPDLW